MPQLSYPNREQVLIVGAPRSGNTYLARLMGELLDSPVTGVYNAVPLAQEGLERTGPYVVRQLHLRPLIIEDAQIALHAGYKFALNRWTTERVIHILRDPRDVAISAYHYWKRPSVLSTIHSMIDGALPFGGIGPWTAFVDRWEKVYLSEQTEHKIVWTSFEHLINYPNAELERIFYKLSLPTSASIDAALSNQSLATKRAQIQRDGDSRPYGKAIQLTHLRKGIVGDWRNHFDAECKRVAHAAWQTHLLYYDYEKDSSWMN